VFLLAMLVSGFGVAEQESQLKAAYIYNFTKYVTWPVAIEQASGKLRVCALARNGFADELSQLDGRAVRSFTIEVRKTDKADALDDCHVLYVSGSGYDKVLRSIVGKPILTISDNADFVALGGMIGMVTESRRIRFDVNLTAARDAQLQVSSRLLQLARRVQ
jgi:hypothetical protein